MDATLKHSLTNVEKAFNMVGCVPVASLVSGVLRVLAGKVQAFVGLIMASLGCFNHICTKDRKWKDVMGLGSEMIMHGVLNALRGFGEAALCSFTIVGNIALLIPNMAQDDEFAPYFAYGSFSESSVRLSF